MFRQLENGMETAGCSRRSLQAGRCGAQLLVSPAVAQQAEAELRVTAIETLSMTYRSIQHGKYSIPSNCRVLPKCWSLHPECSLSQLSTSGHSYP